MNYNSNSGIYFIINIETQNIYVGISNNFKRRWKNHKKSLINGFKNRNHKKFKNNINKTRHHQIYVQLEFNKHYKKYGDNIWDYYIFIPYKCIELKNYDKENLKLIEDDLILRLRKYKNGYNQMTNYEINNNYKFKKNKNKIEITNPIEHDKDYIIALYLNKKESGEQIAKLYNTHGNTIRGYLKRWGIEIRPFHSYDKRIKIENDKNKIIKMYLDENKSALQIAKVYNVSESAILRKLKKWNIKRKTYSEAMLNFDINSEKENIINLYLKNNRSSYEIAKLFNISQSCVLNYLKKWNIKIRNNKEAAILNSIKILIKNKHINYKKIFNSLHECEAELKISRPTLKKYLDLNKTYNNYNFTQIV